MQKNVGVPTSMAMEALCRSSCRASQPPTVQSHVHSGKTPLENVSIRRSLLALLGRNKPLSEVSFPPRSFPVRASGCRKGLAALRFFYKSSSDRVYFVLY